MRDLRSRSGKLANVSGRDVEEVAAEVNRIVGQAQKQLPPGNTILIRGQVGSMNTMILARTSAERCP